MILQLRFHLLTWFLGYNFFFMLEIEICPANKSQITNNRTFFLANIAAWKSLLMNMKCQLLLAFLFLLAEKISCSDELNMKRVLTSGSASFVLIYNMWRQSWFVYSPVGTVSKLYYIIVALHYNSRFHRTDVWDNFVETKATLRKHGYSNIWKTSPKTESFQIQIRIVFLFLLNTECGYRRSGSNAYPQSMFLSRNKKNNVYPCKPHFYYTKVGFKGANII